MNPKRGTPGSGLQGIKSRRDIRNAEMDFDVWFGWAVVAGLLAYAGSFIVFGADSMVPIVVGVVALVVMVVLLVARFVRNPELGLAVGSAAAVVACLLWVVQPLRQLVGDPLPVNVSHYLLAGAAAAAPFAQRYPINNRGVTALLGQLGVLLSVGIGSLFPFASVVVGWVWLLAVMVLRGGGIQWLRTLRGRLRSGVVTQYGKRNLITRRNEAKEMLFADENIERGAAAETVTGRLLDELPEPWKVLHSRSIPGERVDVDHLAIGLPGVFVIDSKDWAGKVTLETVADDDGTLIDAYALNGSPHKLFERLGPVMFEAGLVVDRLALDQSSVNIVVCFTDRMVLHEPIMRLVSAGWNITLVNQRNVLDALRGHPDLLWRESTWRDKVTGRGAPVEELNEKANLRFVRDLQAAADFTFPPA